MKKKRDLWRGVCVWGWLVACNTNHKKSARRLYLVLFWFVCVCGSVTDSSLSLTRLVEWLACVCSQWKLERERESQRHCDSNWVCKQVSRFCTHRIVTQTLLMGQYNNISINNLRGKRMWCGWRKPIIILLQKWNWFWIFQVRFWVQSCK